MREVRNQSDQGTGSMSVASAAGPGRAGFWARALAPLRFGLRQRTTLSIPAIARKVNNGLPQYRDSEESVGVLNRSIVFDRVYARRLENRHSFVRDDRRPIDFIAQSDLSRRSCRPAYFRVRPESEYLGL
jgi:hypothetical protein